MYLADDEELNEDDFLTDEDWLQLEAIYYGLKPFWEVTQRLEGYGTDGSYGVIWEVLPGLEMLLSHVEQQITQLTAQQPPPNEPEPPLTRNRRRPLQNQVPQVEPYTNPLLICYQNAWDVLKKYNVLTDKNHEIYAAATLLNPCVRKAYFEHSWIGNAASMIEPMIQKNRNIWESEYREYTPQVVSTAPRSSLSVYMANLVTSETQQLQDNDFERYINGNVTPWTEWKAQSLYQWWMSCNYPGLRQWALDTLSIPAMSAELERVFSQAKRFYTDDRNRLLASSFEGLQCLLQWHRQRIYDVADPARNNIPPTNQETSFA